MTLKFDCFPVCTFVSIYGFNSNWLPGTDWISVGVLVLSVGVSRPTGRRVSEILAVDMQRDFSKEAAAFSKQKCIAPEASSHGEKGWRERSQDIKMMLFISRLEMFGRDSSLMGSCKLHGQYWHDKRVQHRNQTPQNPQSAWNRAPFVSMLRNQTLTPHRG